MLFRSDKDESVLGAVVNVLNLLPEEHVVIFMGLCSKELRASDSPASAGAAFYKTLHSVFDQWIASGRDGANAWVEMPLERSVTIVTPGYARPLSDDLNDWLVRNTLPQTVDKNGQRVDQAPFVDLRRLKTDPRRAGQDFALFWFLHLMDSPSRYRLACCMNPACRTYFAKERKPRPLIKNGTFCADCKSEGAAIRRDRSRLDQASTLLDAGAKAWSVWKPSRRNPDQRDWVARRVNEQCGTNFQRKWVSQNLQAILEKVEEQRGAKG